MNRKFLQASMRKRKSKKAFRAFVISASATLILVGSSFFAAYAKDASQLRIKTPLTSIEAVTDIDAPTDPDDPGTGGAMDSTSYFSRKLASKLNDCTSQIRSASDVWSRSNQLHETKADQRPGDLLIHVTASGLQGFFEITYRVKLHAERARVTVFFYTLAGKQLEPTQIEALLKTYKIDEFQDNLTHALLCGGG